MKGIASAVLLAVFTAPAISSAAPTNVNELAGCWDTAVEGYAMKLSACGVRYCGELRQTHSGPDIAETDTQNERSHRRQRTLDRMSVAPMLKRRKGSLHGMIYYPDKGRSLQSSLKQEGNQLMVRACRGVRCEKQLFERLDQQQCAEPVAAL